MRKDEKQQNIDILTEEFRNTEQFYLTDSSGLTVAEMNKLRRMCFEKGVTFKVAKNTFIKKALESIDNDYEEVYQLLHGTTAVMISDNANMPAKIIKDFRKQNAEKPVILKGAWIGAAVFIGDDKLDELIKLKSKEELIGEIIGLLQSPAKNVISALKSGGNTIAGLVKALEERNN
jgi:large subunit ribosomal protein L10